MSWLFTTHPDAPLIDLLRGCATWAGVVVFVLAVAVLVLMAQGHWRPPQVRWVVVGIILSDLYVTAREFHERGHRFFPLGLPVALLLDGCFAVYLVTSIVRMRRGEL